MLFKNLCFVVGVLLLLVTSRGAGDNTTQKLIKRCRENERRALLDFKAYVVVDASGILSSWGNDEECCNWRGIRCSNRTGHVTVVNIPGDIRNFTTQLSGKVSPSLFELKHLKYVNLSNNLFGGKIPHQLGNLTSLRSLDLTNNNFGGKIPHQLGNLTNLRSLDFGSSNGQLTVENLDWLSHLHLLTHLDLSFVNLNKSNDWVQQICKLSSLTELHLYSCNLPDSPLLPLNHTTSLNSLSVVDLSFNAFFSPSSYNWFFNFTSSLVQISLSWIFLRGSIPEALGSMASLEYLDMFDCQLEGELPRSFRNLSRLRTLYLDSNNFNGTLSDFLHPLAANKNNSLGVLALGMNQFGGSLPDFTRFPFLREISFRENKLSGSFPETFAQVFGIVSLDLARNQITGSFPNLTLFSSLEYLSLYDNKLEDNIQEAYLSNLSKLKHLDLSFNSFSLNFSFDWAPPFQLDVILLQNCTLGPHFPNWIQSQRNFHALDISYNIISDTIPLWFWDHLPPRLIYLSISYNNFQGILPDLSLKFHAVDSVTLYARYNHLSGPIPSLPININKLDLSQNMFTGSLSFLCTTPYINLYFLDLSDNQLSGELPDCLMNVPRLAILILGKNNLSGFIPTSIESLEGLKALQLHNNNFSGELPLSLMNCKNLMLFDFSENQLSGEVPTWIGSQLTRLRVFSLRKNEFYGRIPLEICHLRNAQVLDFSHNKLSGTVPNCINNITSLVEMDLEFNPLFDISTTAYSGLTQNSANAVVQWKGVPSEYRTTLGLLKLIDLSSNRLVGQIPDEFASLKELISLNLSSNNLTGNIIPKIGQMKNLETLDLSRNQLTGEIPSSLANLTFLDVLNLSNNSLTGQIPSSTQLQSFDASKYAGNELLCGLPLPNKCGDVLEVDDKFPKNGSNQEDDDKFQKIGLYVSVALGFGTGFWGFIGPIMLRRTWRHSYYRLLGNITDWIYVTTILNMARLQRKFYG